MNHPTLLPDGPKLTAYALGELPAEEHAAVEAELRQRPALRAAVEEIRATAAQLEAALVAEVAAGGAAPARFRTPKTDGGAAPVTAAVNGHGGAHPLGGEYRLPASGAKIFQFPRLYFMVAGLAAACFAVMFALRDDRPRAPLPQVPSPSVATTASGAGSGVSAENTEPVGPGLPTGVAPGTGTVADVSSASAGSPAVHPTFLESDLTLMDQAKQDRAGAVAASGPPPMGEPPVGSIPDQPPLPKLSVGAPPPFRSVIEPPPAYAHTPSILPHLGPGSPGAVTPVTSGEIVVLSAFTVTAERTGFAGSAAMSDGRANRDNLQPQPAGARFGRSTEAYSHTPDNDFLGADENPRSTFSIDVDTASYANVRRIVAHGTPPPRDAVRIEELLNYFPYRYAPPKNSDPFAASLEIASAPWAPTHRLVRIGLKAREVSTAERAPANLVFLLDVSGSMNEPNKLPLVKQSMRLLLGRLRADDRVAIVTYAGQSGIALPSTPVARSREILNALDALTPGGSTNGAMGIQLAYEIAKANFAAAGINRVILCTDGDFNVGATSEGELVRLIEEKAASGVFLTVLGFGMGNYKDATLEKLANHGNGNYGYIDTRREAEKLLVEQVSGTLVTVAKDVKIQVEFNPAKVSSYRLIGYENRLLKKEDFNNDRVDAGEIGAGHTVTALYEIVPVGAEEKRPGALLPLENLRYGSRGAVSSRLEMPVGVAEPPSNELLTVAVRFKKPDGLFNLSRLLEFPLVDAGKSFATASADFRFAAAVAQYGMILRGSPHRGTATIQDVARWATATTNDGGDPGGYRAEFLDLVRKTQALLE